jgi:hypothetical protein
MVLLLLLLLNPHTFHPHIRMVHKIFHPHILLVLKKQKNLHPHIRKRHQIFHPHHHAHHHLLLFLLLLMKQQNLHPKRKCSKQSCQSTSGPNTSVIGPGETPLGKKALEKPSAISKLQEEKLAKNNSSATPTAGKQALKKPSSAISK